MIRIQQLKMPIPHSEEALRQKIVKTLRIRQDDLQQYEIIRRSIDARKKETLFYVYQIDAVIRNENAVLRRQKGSQITKSERIRYHFPHPGTVPLKNRPVVIGSGPAGLFCTYMLAKAGYRPILLERGAPAAKRKADVERFWKTGVLNPESNVQFGEGGAGTFSDGKLNTTVKDTYGRNREVLSIFVKAGAPKEILYDQKPHLGTDQLISIVESMRASIEHFGGTVRFGAKVTGFQKKDGRLSGLIINGTEQLDTEVAVLAVGHSARDTFFELEAAGVHMEAKSFAVGVRMEHPQEMINRNQYGENPPAGLGAAPYKVTCQLENGRGVYSFCMCPGGYVVNASSEEGQTCVNGMSYSGRDGKNANSAIIVTVNPKDFTPYHVDGTNPVFDGIAFQRHLERAAYLAGGGAVPVQLFGDFCQNRISEQFQEVQPSICGTWVFGDVAGIFPDEIRTSLVKGIQKIGEKFPGFARADALLSGVEARTSSPIRIVRGEELESISMPGLYPCGEGAGYAGGITSAAMDGLKTAEKICEKYMNFI